MGGKQLKRGLETSNGEDASESPLKRRRQANEANLNLIKLYDDLAAESDEVRLDAAKQLIIKFSPENMPSAHEVEKALHRLVRGLCSQRKAARVGFCITLTELLRQLFAQSKTPIPDFNLDVNNILEMVEKKTKVEGNVPGQVSASIFRTCDQCVLTRITRKDETTLLANCSDSRLSCNLQYSPNPNWTWNVGTKF